jgi:hypothetical protein
LERLSEYGGKTLDAISTSRILAEAGSILRKSDFSVFRTKIARAAAISTPVGRLKQVVIGTVDQDYFRGCLSQRFGSGQSSETAAYDHHIWRLICHGLQSSGVCLYV